MMTFFFYAFIFPLWLLAKGTMNSALVLLGLKWTPPTGDPRWRRTWRKR